MISFSSTFSIVNSADNATGPVIATNIKDTLRNIGRVAMNRTLNSVKANKGNDMAADLEYFKNDQQRDSHKLATHDAPNISNQYTFGQDTRGINTNINAVSKVPVSLKTTAPHGLVYDYENPFKLPAAVLDSFNKYKYVFNNAAVTLMNAQVISNEEPTAVGLQNVGDMDNVDYPVAGQVISSVISPSLFNPFFGVQVNGFTRNTPLIHYNDLSGATQITAKNIDEVLEGERNLTAEDWNMLMEVDSMTPEEMANMPKKTQAEVNVVTTINNEVDDITDCSIKKLIELSSTPGDEYSMGARELGMATFRYSDFMYCKDLGKVANNHLIVLRKFPHPVGDNIYTRMTSSSEDTLSPDVGRLISWFGTDDNKIEDICQFNYNTEWKRVEANIDEINSSEDEKVSTIASLVNFMNPSYRQQVIEGVAGSSKLFGNIGSSITNIKMLNKIPGFKTAAGITSKLFEGELGQYKTVPQAQYNADKNYKVYEPMNSLQANHIEGSKLIFNQSFNLNFSYKLRAYDNINPRSAFIDLIGNILEVTYKRGRFWGGSRRLFGPPQNKEGWKMTQDLVDMAFDKAGGIFDKIATGDIDFSSMLSGIGDGIWNLAKGTVKGIAEKTKIISKMISGNEDTGSNMQGNMQGALQKASGKVHEGLNVAAAIMKAKIGLPQIYAWHAYVNADNVGYWHLSIGNPRNPFMVIGNLIMTSAKIQQSGPLGLDDFPTDLRVTVTLEHAKPRDITEISKMYTMGQSTIYHKLGTTSLSNYYTDLMKNINDFPGVINADEDRLESIKYSAASR